MLEHIYKLFKTFIYLFSMKKYTIKDIAQLAGVSKGTVDRVIHNRGKVSKNAFDRVSKLLKEIDYQPNPIARNLKNNKIYRIHVLLPDPEKDKYWEPCIDGIEEAIQEFLHFGVSIEKVFFNPFDKRSFERQSAGVLRERPDGILLVPLFQKESLVFIEKCEALGVSYFLFNSNIEKIETQGFVGQDLFQSGRVGAQLIHKSLKKNAVIAVIHIDEVFKNATHMQEKEKGFRAYFNDLEGDDFQIDTYKLKHRNSDNLKKTVKYFIDTHPEISGAFVTNSKIHLLAALLRENNPERCIVGYDLLSENVRYLKSGTINFLIHQNPKRQAYLGLVFLIEHFLFNRDIPSVKHLPIDIINSENVSTYLDS